MNEWCSSTVWLLSTQNLNYVQCIILCKLWYRQQCYDSVQCHVMYVVGIRTDVHVYDIL